MSQNDSLASTQEQLKDLVYENRWLITNRWAQEEFHQDALRLADELVAIATGQQPQGLDDNQPREATDLSGLTPVSDYSPPEWLVPGNDFPIVGRRFSAAEFIAYIKWVRSNESYAWSPTGITMHHTGYPHLSMRPNGFNEQHMLNLRSYYRDRKRWRSGPHIFTDDHGIWVLTPLSLRGVHAVSFNSSRYGIEMLGNFDTDEDYDNQRGHASRRHGKIAAAVLMKHAGISTAKLNFHRHDPETSKSCPGERVDFSAFEEDVLEMAATL